MCWLTVAVIILAFVAWLCVIYWQVKNEARIVAEIWHEKHKHLLSDRGTDDEI
jgi:hypothetical protein